MAGTPNVDVTSSTLTSIFLLEGLRDPNNQSAWHEFCARYRPLIVAYAQHSYDFGPEDAEDVAQASLLVFMEAYRRGEYDRAKGRLRHWLFGIATNRLREAVRRRERNREIQVTDGGSGTGLLQRIPDDAVLEEQWEEEWRRAVCRQCLSEVRREFDAKTVEAFELFVQGDVPADQVADRLGTSRNAVYLAKHHILKRIRALVPQMEEIW
jgi:RNA polymerase sigma-70 factor, ECF subfamily